MSRVAGPRAGGRGSVRVPVAGGVRGERPRLQQGAHGVGDPGQSGPPRRQHVLQGQPMKSCCCTCLLSRPRLAGLMLSWACMTVLLRASASEHCEIHAGKALSWAQRLFESSGPWRLSCLYWRHDLRLLFAGADRAQVLLGQRGAAVVVGGRSRRRVNSLISY